MKCSVPNVSWRAVAGAHPYLHAHGHARTHIHRGTKKTGRLPVLGALWEQMRGQDEGLGSERPSHCRGAYRASKLGLIPEPASRAGQSSDSPLWPSATSLASSQGASMSGKGSKPPAVQAFCQHYPGGQIISLQPREVGTINPFYRYKAEAQAAKEVLLFPDYKCES